MPSRACHRRFRGLTRALLACLAVCALTPVSAFAQRELHWQAIEVAAHLDSAGALHVIETQTIVFSGDWNGGERRFNLRPRQQLSFDGIYRDGPGGWQALTQDSSLDDVDDYAWTDQQTLRWRSRRTSDPPFAATSIRYELRYVLSSILLKEGDRYRLDHDFAFPDRDGPIDHFTLRLTLDPAWRPMSEMRPLYTAGPLPPGASFVLTVPIQYEGTDVPGAIDLTRPPEIVLGVSALVGMMMLAVLWFFVREQSYGRFAPLAQHVDEPWLHDHVLKYPAEVVAAIWDEIIGSAEVVALIARMVSERKLKSTVGKGKSASMTLRLKVDRATLQGYERTLVDRLFFNGRTETSTSDVRAHYRSTGFTPSEDIKPELAAAVEQVLAPGRAPRRFKAITVALFVLGIGLIVFEWFQGYPGAFLVVLLMIVVTGIGWLTGHEFRAHIEWGRRAALLCLMPALIIGIGVAAFLWFSVGRGTGDLQPLTVVGLIVLALSLMHSSINALKSRRHREAIAFRKALAAGRAFFVAELRKAQPALRDEWYPWLLAFELGKQVDDWSAQRPDARSDGGRATDIASAGATTSSYEPSSDRWSGFTGGRSGGAGGGASWQAAAGSMAAHVSPPSSSGSSGGSDSSSSGSSSGGSSGGGGGGGW
jgi:hypothetical protein